MGRELAELLTGRDGFYAYESALLVRPLQNAGGPMGLIEWNLPARWSAYERVEPLLFFAEDIFGHPFALGAQGVVSFDLETGESETLAPTLEAWAQQLDEDPNLWTGWVLAHEWQERFGAIPLGHRLVPRQPFVLGGEYRIDNLVLVAEEEGLRARANLAQQIRHHPVGQSITYELRPAR
jgi:hypothetical protein